MKKILLTALVCNAFTYFSQLQEERVLEDRTHQITIIAKNYTKEEMANFKYHRIPTTQEVIQRSCFPIPVLKSLSQTFKWNPKLIVLWKRQLKLFLKKTLHFLTLKVMKLRLVSIQFGP